MASESTNGGATSVGLSDDLDAWLDDRADELGLGQEELLERLLASYRVAVTADDAGDLQARADTVEERLDRLEHDHQTGLEDVRKRVLQLKRATEANADADHDHEELDRVAELDEQVAALADRVEQLSEQVQTLTRRAPDDTVSREEFQDTREKLSRVARAVLALRRQADRTASSDGDGEDDPSSDAAAVTAERSASSTPAPAVDAAAAERLLDLKRTAAREGYERARCDACGETVHVGLLPEPACPACATQFDEIVERGSLRKKATLVGDGGEE